MTDTMFDRTLDFMSDLRGMAKTDFGLAASGPQLDLKMSFGAAASPGPAAQPLAPAIQMRTPVVAGLGR